MHLSSFLKILATTSIALLCGCGGGNENSLTADTQDSTGTTLLIPLSKIAGTWERKCWSSPVFMLTAADANGNRSAVMPRADNYITFTQINNQLSATQKWVIYDYTDTNCTGPVALTVQTSSANLDNQTGTTARGGTLSINRGPEIWESIGSAIATDPNNSTTATLDHFKLTFPALFPETLDYPTPTVALFKRSGDFLFPAKYAGSGFAVVTIVNEEVRDESGNLTGETTELLSFGTSTTPTTLASAITFFFNTHHSGYGHRRSAP
jgi:hypothetical protein